MEPAHPSINSTYFGLLAEFGEANIPLAKIAPKYFGLSFAEARRRAPAKNAPVPSLQTGRPEVPMVGERDGPRRVDRRATGTRPADCDWYDTAGGGPHRLNVRRAQLAHLPRSKIRVPLQVVPRFMQRE